jgi:lipopolysaccharide transport system ATP-binding protein
MNAIEFNHVWKKFRKGERFDSLRDLIPTFTRNLFSWGNKNQQELRDKEFWAVNDVSFQIKKGDILGIIGHNGAGKSTILKLLSGILQPTKGEIILNGRLSALIEVGAGFHNDLTGRENIYLNGAILGMKKQEIDKKFDSIVAFSELEEFIDTPVKRYSSGMYVRLGFSVAAHLDPEILLIDEVLSVGDFRFQRKCMAKMNEFVTKGTTIIYISHNLPSVIELCPKTLLLNRGEVQQIGESRQVVHDYYRAWGDVHRVDHETIKLEKSFFVDSAGGETSTFSSGQGAALRLKFIASEDLRCVAVAFVVKRQDGMVIFDAHSEMTAHKTYDFAAGRASQIEIQFRNALPEGLYYAGVYLQTEASKIHFYDDELLQFHVIGPKLSGTSFTFLEPEWK